MRECVSKVKDCILYSNMYPHRWMATTHQVPSYDGLQIDTITSSTDSLCPPHQDFLNPFYPTSMNGHCFNTLGNRLIMSPWAYPMSTQHGKRILNPIFPSLAILAIRRIQTIYPFRPLLEENSPFCKDHQGGNLPITLPTTTGCTNHHRNSRCGPLCRGPVQSSKQPPSHMYQNLVGASSNQPIQSFGDFESSLEIRMKELTKRRPFKPYQLLVLEKEFRIDNFLTWQSRTEIAQALGVTEKKIQCWFQNRRSKRRKGKY